jgi:hypothetical protein
MAAEIAGFLNIFRIYPVFSPTHLDRDTECLYGLTSMNDNDAARVMRRKHGIREMVSP